MSNAAEFLAQLNARKAAADARAREWPWDPATYDGAAFHPYADLAAPDTGCPSQCPACGGEDRWRGAVWVCRRCHPPLDKKDDPEAVFP